MRMLKRRFFSDLNQEENVETGDVINLTNRFYRVLDRAKF